MVRKISLADCFCVYLFGTFRIERNLQPIFLPTEKTKSLFSYLILCPGGHTRERLAAAFWGDTSDVKAQGSLRKALTFLRKSIDKDIILANQDKIQLNPAIPLWVDVFEFEQWAHQFMIDPSPDLESINFDLYQLDLLSESYDDWVLPLRQHYHALYMDTLFRAVEQLRAQSEYKSAITYAQKILALDPANERAHQHLMFCHITLGDRNKALQQYEACQRALWDELAVEPTRETQALHNWIRQSVTDLSSLAARLTNLPIPISSFVGRSRELTKVKQLLSHTRLVTLTGAGGSGKTRLAIHAATDLIDSFKDGIWWVELAPLTDPSLVPSVVAKALGISGKPEQEQTEVLAHFLRTKQILLILDNCEHLINACAQLTEHLLNICPDLKILCTSREMLGLVGERVWRVPTLSLPDMKGASLAELFMHYESVCLFVERANAVNPDFSLTEKNALVVVQICQQLDGMPLAIELAAARIKTLSVEQIVSKLHDRFRLLTAENRTSQTRHQTLRAAIDWSYDMLTNDERLLFCRLSVFSGGWGLDAAEAVCSGKGVEKNDILHLLARLVDKSLIFNTDGQRYSILETIKQYAAEKITDIGELNWVRQQHLDYYVWMARIVDDKIRGSEQLTWFKRFEMENGNITNAMEISFGSHTMFEKGCDLVCSTCWCWGMLGDFVSIKHWLMIALSHVHDLKDDRVKANLLYNAGFYSTSGVPWLEPVEAEELVQESLDIWSRLGSGFSVERARCLLTLGYIQKSIFNNEIGYEYIEQAIAVFKEQGNIWWHAWALNYHGMIMVQDSKEIHSIRKILEEEISLWEKTGDQCNSAHPLFDLGTLALEHGDYIEAQRYFQESLQLYNRVGAKGYSFQALQHLAEIARSLKQYDDAEIYFNEMLLLAPALMWDSSLSVVFHGLGCIALHRGNNNKAEEHFYRACKIARVFDQKPSILLCVADFACVAFARGDLVIAIQLFGTFFAQMAELQIGTKLKKTVIESVDQVEIEECLALCRSQVHPSVFNQAWEAGRFLPLDNALDEAMKRVA